MAKESTFNTHPSSGGTWNGIRLLSESLKQDLTLGSSDEIRAYRDIPELNLTDKGVSGSINTNLYYDTKFMDEVFMGALGASSTGFSDSGSSNVVFSGTMAIDQDARRYSATLAHQPQVGEWVYITGAANAASNGYHQCASASAGNFTVNAPIGADEGSVSLVVRTMPEITNYNPTLSSYSIQRDYTSLSNIGEYFTGCVIDGLTIDCTGQDTAKVTTDFVGVSAVSDTSSETIDNAAATNPAMTTINGVQMVREGTGAGNTAGIECLGFTINVSNNNRKRYELGTLGPKSMALGDFVVTGTLQMYFATSTLFDKFLNQTATALCMGISDETTGASTLQNGYVFDFPNVRFTDGQRVAGGRNQDIIADMSWQAIHNGDSSGYTMKIART